MNKSRRLAQLQRHRSLAVFAIAAEAGFLESRIQNRQAMEWTGYPHVNRLLVGQFDTSRRNDVARATSYRALGSIPLVALVLAMHVEAEVCAPDVVLNHVAGMLDVAVGHLRILRDALKASHRAVVVDPRKPAIG